MTLKQIAARALNSLAYNTPIGSRYPAEIAHPIEQRFGLVGYTAAKVSTIRLQILDMARAENKRRLRPDEYHWYNS